MRQGMLLVAVVVLGFASTAVAAQNSGTGTKWGVIFWSVLGALAGGYFLFKKLLG